jgi:hypothetical protein
VKIGATQKEAIMQATTSWEEKGIEKERRSLISLLLQQKVGKLPDTLSDRVSTLALDQLSTLAIALLNFSSIDDLSNWLNALGTRESLPADRA